MANAFSELGSGLAGVKNFWDAGYEATREAGSRLFNNNQYNANNPFGGDFTPTAQTGSMSTNSLPQAKLRSEVQATSNPNSGTYSDPGVDASAAERAALLFGLDQQLQGAQQGISSLGTKRDVGLGNIDRDFQYQLDSLLGNRSRNLDRYQQAETDQLNQYQQKRSNNDTEAANWLLGARRTLGSQGAGGGSAARYALPFEAQTQAAAANSTDQATNKANIAAIAGSRQTDEDQFTNAQNDLVRQRDQGRNDFLSGLAETEAGLQSNVQGLQGQRTIANGGSLDAAKAAASPYTSRINELLAQIDNYARTPDIKAQQVTLGRPDLSGYNWANSVAAPVATQDPSLGGKQVIAPTSDQQDPRKALLSLFGLDDNQYQYA